MRILIENYAAACRAAGAKVDAELLGDMMPRLTDDEAGAAEV
jgi:hypothetical protein